MIRLPLFSGSGIKRAVACPPSSVLPHVNGTGKYAARGNAVHAYLACVAKLGRDEALDTVPEEYRDICAALNLDELPVGVGEWSPEVAFVLHLDGREGGDVSCLGPDHGDRNYGTLAPSDIPGTADVVGLTPDAVVVGDFKTGRTWSREQLEFLSYCAMEHYQRNKAIAFIAWIRESGEVSVMRMEFSAFDLADYPDRMAAAAVAIQKADKDLAAGHVDVTEGEHCSYCPAWSSCPAKGRQYQALVASPVSTIDTFEAVSDQQLGEEYVRIVAAQTILARRKEAIKERAKMSQVPLPGGKSALGVVVSSREKVTDGRAAHALLEGSYGRVVADAACSFDASKSSIEAAIKPWAKEHGEKAAPHIRKMLDALRGDGSIQSTRVERVEEVPLLLAEREPGSDDT